MYNYPGMMKITKEEAVELLNRGTVSIYLLYEDGTEAEESDIDTIMEFDGEIGYEKIGGTYSYSLTKEEVQAIEKALGWDMNDKVIPSSMWLTINEIITNTIESYAVMNEMEDAATRKMLLKAKEMTDKLYEDYLKGNGLPGLVSGQTIHEIAVRQYLVKEGFLK